MIIAVWVFALVAAAVHLLAFAWEVVLLDRRSVYQGVFHISADDLPAVRLWASASASTTCSSPWAW
jgi:putative membrane protein